MSLLDTLDQSAPRTTGTDLRSTRHSTQIRTPLRAHVLLSRYPPLHHNVIAMGITTKAQAPTKETRNRMAKIVKGRRDYESTWVGTLGHRSYRVQGPVRSCSPRAQHTSVPLTSPVNVTKRPSRRLHLPCDLRTHRCCCAALA